MKLSKAARYGDTVTAVDTLTPATTVLVQFDPLSYAKIDGVAVRKRAISAEPSVTVPEVITIGSDVYLVGTGVPDYWKGAEIRRNYVIQGADGLANLTTIAAALANTAPATAYASLVFSKYSTDQRESSDYWPQYQIFLAGSESAPYDSMVQLNSKWYLVKESYLSQSGLRIAMVNELFDPVFETINYKARTYTASTDTWAEATTSVKVMRVRWTEHFQYISKASENYERGDLQVFVLKSAVASPKVSDKLPLSDGTYTVLSVQDEGLCWSMHMRR